MDDDTVQNLSSLIEIGIYCGFAQINDGPVYKMVMSLGNNPFFGSTKKCLVRYDYHRLNVLLFFYF